MKALWHALLIVLAVLTTQAFAEPQEEKAALTKILPQFKEAWNSGEAEDIMALFHSDCPMKKAYDKDEKAKEECAREFKELVKIFGKVESFEIRKYIQTKGRYVVRVTYTKKGMVPGTFAVRGDEKHGWFIFDFNIDGQGEPELKE